MSLDLLPHEEYIKQCPVSAIDTLFNDADNEILHIIDDKACEIEDIMNTYKMKMVSKVIDQSYGFPLETMLKDLNGLADSLCEQIKLKLKTWAEELDEIAKANTNN